MIKIHDFFRLCLPAHPSPITHQPSITHPSVNTSGAARRGPRRGPVLLGTFRGLCTERARLGTERGFGTERARLGTFRGFGTERARLGSFRGFGTERCFFGQKIEKIFEKKSCSK